MSSRDSSSIRSEAPQPCWPPTPLVKGVVWLRGNPLWTATIVITAVCLVIGLYTMKNTPLDVRLIAGSAAFGAVLIVALPILFEWRRQSHLEEATKQREAEKSRSQRLESYRTAVQAAPKHRQLLIHALGGEEAFLRLPVVQFMNPNNVTSGMMLYPMQRDTLKISCDGQEETVLDYIALKIRLKNPQQKTPQRVGVCVIYQKYLAEGRYFEGTVTPAYQIIGDGKNLFTNFKPASDCHNPLIITSEGLNAEQRPTLIALAQIYKGKHATLELAE